MLKFNNLEPSLVAHNYIANCHLFLANQMMGQAIAKIFTSQQMTELSRSSTILPK